MFFFFTGFSVGRATVSKLRDCLEGKRRRLPYHFAAVYPGRGKEKIGAAAHLDRVAMDRFELEIRWFRTTATPPPEFGKLNDLFSCLGKSFGEKLAWVGADFSYKRKSVESLFKPIPVEQSSQLFTEITGLTGVKRNPEGKILYELEVELDKTQLEHRVRFGSVVSLSEQLPLALLEKASDISALAFRVRDQS